MKTTIFYLIVLVFVPLSVLGKNNYFEKGIQAAKEKEFKTASLFFEKIISLEPENINAYFNLGNCYFKTKEFGKAIWAFEKVLKLNPQDPNAWSCIELCYDEIDAGIQSKSPISFFQRFIHSVGISFWTTAMIISSWILAAIIFMLLYRKSNPLKRYLFVAFSIAILFFLSNLMAATSIKNNINDQKFAIVTEKTTNIGMNKFPVQLKARLPEGTKVEILEHKNGFLKVMTEKGEVLILSESVVRSI